MPHKKERRIGESGYLLPEHMPPGEVVSGLKYNENGFIHEEWRIGKTLGIVNLYKPFYVRCKITDSPRPYFINILYFRCWGFW